MPATADTTAIPRVELEQLIERYSESWARRDPDAIAAFRPRFLRGQVQLLRYRLRRRRSR
jgi:hypothetical protein